MLQALTSQHLVCWPKPMVWAFVCLYKSCHTLIKLWRLKSCISKLSQHPQEKRDRKGPKSNVLVVSVNKCFNLGHHEVWDIKINCFTIWTILSHFIQVPKCGISKQLEHDSDLNFWYVGYYFQDGGSGFIDWVVATHWFWIPLGSTSFWPVEFLGFFL